MIEANHLTKRYGKTVAVNQPVPLAQTTTGIYLGTNRRPADDLRLY